MGGESLSGTQLIRRIVRKIMYETLGPPDSVKDKAIAAKLDGPYAERLFPLAKEEWLRWQVKLKLEELEIIDSPNIKKAIRLIDNTMPDLQQWLVWMIIDIDTIAMTQMRANAYAFLERRGYITVRKAAETAAQRLPLKRAEKETIIRLWMLPENRPKDLNYNKPPQTHPCLLYTSPSPRD